MQSDVCAVVLAAGNGKRMKSSLPKVLHTVGGMEMINIVIGTIKSACIDSIIVVTPNESSEIAESVNSEVDFVTQPFPLGTGDALAKAEKLCREYKTIIVLMADTPLILPETIEKMLDYHTRINSTVTMLTSTLLDPYGMGRIVRSDDGRVIRIIEHNVANELTKSIPEINAGVYCFDSKWLWENIKLLRPSSRGDVLITDLILIATSKGYNIQTIPSKTKQEALGVNSPTQLAEAELAMIMQSQTNSIVEKA